MNVRQMREHANEVRDTNPKRAAMFDRFADRMEREQATLKQATDVTAGDLLQGVNGTAFLVTDVELTTNPRTGKPAMRYAFDGVNIPFYTRPGENIRHYAEHTNDGTGTCQNCGLDLVKASADAWATATPAERHAARDEAMREATLGLRGW